MSKGRSKNLLLKVILEGLYDNESNLSKLRGVPHIMKKIWNDVRKHTLSQIILPFKNDLKVKEVSDENIEDNSNDDDENADDDKGSEECSFYFYNETNAEYKLDSLDSKLFVLPIKSRSGFYKFPKPSNININMMPFIVAERFQDCR